MKERYEIRGKIGQGGMGSVFRALDTRMNREVAIKRICREQDEPLQEEASQQILKEAGALASLQHPHIVTVYDVGTDEEGPYVVMELISGKTLDELIERAPLTWPDFRELAMQTQEALIAAQELDLVHRDIKPSNLMLTWLPSGKFQVKIVDFGLAKFGHSAALDHMETADTVLGSIYFMCPEQFERAVLDARADMYSMGCVYYHALSGVYPFNGETGMQVMTAHLHHQVIPLHEVRPDVPRWACDWVMWHINRLATDRPQNAREALKLFFHNDNSPVPVMQTSPPQPAAEQPKRPRLIIPGAAPQAPAKTPEPASRNPLPIPAPVAAAVPVAAPGVPEPPHTQTAPQPLAPPEGSKPSVHNSPTPAPAAEPAPAPTQPPPVVLQPAAALASSRTAAPAAATGSENAAPVKPPAVALRPRSAASVKSSPRLAPRAKPGPIDPAASDDPAAAGAAAPGMYKKPVLSNAAKVVIAALLGIMVVFLILAIAGKSGTNKRTEIYNRLLTTAARDDVKELPVNKEELQVLLDAAVDVGANKQRDVIYKALWLAKATDSTDVDLSIAQVATKQVMAEDIRVIIIRDVLRKRKNPVVVPVLMDYIRTANNTSSAIAAIQACRFMATDKDFPKFIELIATHSNPSIRQEAEANAGEILKKSPNRESLGESICTALSTATEAEVKYSLTRLLGCAGGAKAAGLVTKALASSDKKEQLAAVNALGAWADDSMFATYIKQLDSVTDVQLRAHVFDAGLRFLANPNADGKRTSANSAEYWKMLANSAKTREDQEKIIRQLANKETADWAIAIIKGFVDSSKEDHVIDLGEKAIDHMRSSAKRENTGADNN
jgi:serine/threonine protein kinase